MADVKDIPIIPMLLIINVFFLIEDGFIIIEEEGFFSEACIH